MPSTPARDESDKPAEDLADLLARERDATALRLATLTDSFAEVVAASRDSNADDEHDPEGSTIAFERSQLDALVQQARRHLVEIDAALTRLADGSYGQCLRCDRSIPVDRLRARPTARTCVSCARGSEGDPADRRS